jgi:hypothetical protein
MLFLWKEMEQLERDKIQKDKRERHTGGENTTGARTDDAVCVDTERCIIQSLTVQVSNVTKATDVQSPVHTSCTIGFYLLLHVSAANCSHLQEATSTRF